MRNSGDAPADVRRFLETIGIDGEPEVGEGRQPVSSERARASDVYKRSLARAYLSELRHTKAA